MGTFIADFAAASQGRYAHQLLAYLGTAGVDVDAAQGYQRSSRSKPSWCPHVSQSCILSCRAIADDMLSVEHCCGKCVWVPVSCTLYRTYEVHTWFLAVQQPGDDLLCISCCRLPLSQACACMSFGMFLSLCFNAPGLEVFGTPIHSGFVRYFGLGRSVMCLHQDTIYPSSVVVPRMKVTYSLNAQLIWLKQEAAELCQVSRSCVRLLKPWQLCHAPRCFWLIAVSCNQADPGFCCPARKT